MTDLQHEVLAALNKYGPMTDERLVRLPRFRRYAPSTIRSRRAELVENGRVRARETRRNKRGRRVQVWARTAKGRLAVS